MEIICVVNSQVLFLMQCRLRTPLSQLNDNVLNKHFSQRLDTDESSVIISSKA